MHAEVAVAQLEPIRLAETPQHLHGAPALIGHTPATLRVRQAGKRVHDGVDVGRNAEPHVLEIVARIDDDGELLRRQNRRKTGGELGPAYSAAQGQHVTGHHRNKSCGKGRKPSVAATSSAVT